MTLVHLYLALLSGGARCRWVAALPGSVPLFASCPCDLLAARSHAWILRFAAPPPLAVVTVTDSSASRDTGRRRRTPDARRNSFHR